MHPLIEWLLPIAIGALIGFVTNAIAIKMLFRPLEEKRIGPFRIPFTPGVIPRQRHKLAANLGRVVSRELLSPEVILNHLDRMQARQNLANKLFLVAGDFLRLSLKQVYENYHSMIGLFATMLSRVLISGADWILDIQLKNVLPLFSDRHSKEALKTDHIDPSSEEEPHPAVQSIIDVLFPLFKQEMESWVRSPSVMKHLNQTGQRLLEQAIEEMNPLQRVLVRSLGYDQQLSDSMPRLSETVVNRFVSYFSLPQEQQDFSRRVSRILTHFFKNGLQSGSLKTYLREWIEEHQHLSILDALALFLGLSVAEIKQKIKTGLEGTEDFALDVLKRLLAEDWASQPLDSLLSIKEDPLNQWANEISGTLLNWASSILPELLTHLDLPRMLEERVNGMNLETVESMLIQIMQKQFKWINVFGAILGAIMGLLQGGWRILYTLLTQ